MMLNPGWHKTKSERLVADELSCDFGDEVLINFLRKLDQRRPWRVFSIEGQVGDTEVREVDASPFTRPCGMQGFHGLRNVLVIFVLEFPYCTLLIGIHGFPQSEHGRQLLVVSGRQLKELQNTL
jgi:hypothetical protein